MDFTFLGARNVAPDVGPSLLASISQTSCVRHRPELQGKASPLKAATFSVSAAYRCPPVSSPGVCAEFNMFRLQRRRSWRKLLQSSSLLQREVNFFAHIWTHNFCSIMQQFTRLQTASQSFWDVNWRRLYQASSLEPLCNQTSAAIARSRTHRRACAWAEKALQAERALDLEQAIHYYEQALEHEPKNAENWARLSKQYSDMTFTPGMTADRVRQVNQKGIEYGVRAITEDPSCVLGHVAICISKGRLALFSDNHTKVKLAKEAQDQVGIALQIDPNHDIALHLMGRWHYEMAGLNVVVRTIVRWVYNTNLMVGSYQGALQYFQAAANAAPQRLVHRVELARTQSKLGLFQEAVKELETALVLDVEDINAYQLLEDAKVQLKTLRKKV